MSILNRIYNQSLSLLTDFYQLTMAYAYYNSGRANDEAVFHLYFRQNPFGGGYTVAAGLELVIDYIKQFQFKRDDIDYLKSLKNNDGTSVFKNDFLDLLTNLKITCPLKAVPEGTIVFPHEPILQIKGSLLQCQLLETPLLNFINFHSLIATKASRIKYVAKNERVLEFGLRGAQGLDGALSASRAAFIGGTDATSNTLAGKLFGIPVRGTHSHSWVMSFDNEEESFIEFARALPNFTYFLVDTYNTLEGVKAAIRVGEKLKQQGQKLLGIRLDSGDLAYLSIEARKLLDDAGFNDAHIVASNDLNEKLMESLKNQGAKIGVWGIGTQLVASFDQPALGVVYKLTALKNNKTGLFEHRIKVSEQAAKTSTPGILQVCRYSKNGVFVADMIYDELIPINKNSMEIIDPADPTRFRIFESGLQSQELLVPIFENGKCVYEVPKLTDIQSYVFSGLNSLHTSIKRFDNPHHFPAGLERNLYDHKIKLIMEKKKRV